PRRLQLVRSAPPCISKMLAVRRLANPVDGHARLGGLRLAGSLARVLISSAFARARLPGSGSYSSR
ncbi:uncharacterized protein SCHCODRAFT_02636440, partial [Schizophyllum commune H4-8]|uniref:uncharacterized protein n=1 Tax=Schizophyllum commune (strain H4-8 / FGSC 9210) TaxID=578458 RepID=UPI00215E5384